MADRARCDLPYGHFGRGTYSLEDHTWYFERNLALSSTTQLLEEPRILSKPSDLALNASNGAHQKGPSFKRHQKQIKALTDPSAHLRPVSGILTPLLRVSEAAQDAVRQYDPLKGRLIAFGDIQSHIRNRPISVAAYVSGDSGCTLCIIQVQKQKRGWEDDRRSWLEVPTLQGQQTTWSSHGGPIQQVYFSSNIQPGPDLLAVRLLTRTSIMRAVQVKKPSDDAQGSSITSSILHDIDMRHTGGHAHVDVAFNPWYPQQVAVIDVAGKWTVLEFATRNMGQVARKWSGTARIRPPETRSSSNDAWARIAWVLNLGTLAVCTREALTLFNVVENNLAMLEEVELGLSGAIPWVLDFLVLPEHRDHFCVLTTTHILVYKLEDSATSKKTSSIKFKIRHYRNPEDLSLRLTAWTEDNGKGIGLLLYSSFLGLLCSYTFTLATNSAVTADHIDFQLTRAQDSIHDPRSIVSIGLHRMELAHKPTTRIQERSSKSARFFSALVAREGVATYQMLFCIGSSAAISPFSWEARLATSSFKLSRHDFVVEDSPIDVEDSTRGRAEPVARRARHAKVQRISSDQTIDLQRVTDRLQHPIEDPEPFAEVLEAVKSELLRPHLGTPPIMRTLHGFAQAELSVRDIEECSAALEQLSTTQNEPRAACPGLAMDMDDQEHRLTLAAVDIPPSLGLENLRPDAGLASVYDQALATWITPLSETVTGRVRLARAKLCGLVAAQLVLASQSLRVEDQAETQPSQEQEQEQTQTQTQSQVSGFQLSGHRGFASSQLDSSQPLQSSALPTPSQTPSITTASSYPSTIAAPELNRLSKYTTFTKPPPPALPRALNNVLSHWNVGEDIKDYDWMSTSRKLTQQNEDADDDMTEAERRRAQRRAERHMKRQRKEAAASQALQIASSQAPEIFSASQPTGMRVESQPGGIAASSQFTGLGTGAAAASQVEAGRFGGRPVAAAGKKRRRRGF